MSALLEREYNELRSRRVNLRRQRERLVQAAAWEPQKRYGPDGYNNAITWTEAELRGTQKRWEELHLLLGKRIPGPPVKLDAPVRRYGSATRSPGGYVTKVIVPR
jgi:hypothetical protein